MFFFIFLFAILTLQIPIANAAEPRPEMLKDVGIEPKLGETIPLDLTFQDEAGQTVALKKFFDGEHPVILTLVYYECPNLCNYLLNGLTDAMKKISWEAGKEFQIVSVSIEPKETSELAAKKREAYLKEYGKGANAGWNFLVGKEPNIRKLADAVGFRYKYDEEIQQYAHAAGIFLLSPEGKLTRTLFGITFDPKDLRLGLLEASAGKVRSIIDRITLFCYRYDPKANKYALFASNAMKVAGALTVVALGLLLVRSGQKRG